MRELTPDNHLVEGSLWSDPERFEVSLERDYASELRVGLGSVLSFDVQGVPIELVVTSLRTVEWESFGINFFLVAEPGALDEAPHFLLAAARLEPAQETRLQDALAAQYSNVTPIRVHAILEKVQHVLERLAVGVHALGLFTVLTGLAILAGVAARPLPTAAARLRSGGLWV
jgi:putative ABC transport system permease protein